MPKLDTLSHLALFYGPVVLIVVATFLALEAVFLGTARRRRERGEINARLRVLARTDDREAALIELRRLRGLTADGGYQIPFIAFNRLLMQSGLAMRLNRLLSLMAGLALSAGLVAYALTATPLAALLASIAAGIAAPVAALLIKRTRRLKRLEQQLPEAIDVMVRSLRAGHPVPVAVALVAREMPDPIGTEFGMASDEMTYGMDLVTAMSNMRTRAGQSDLSLLVVAISIQATSGGNLAEILTGLTRMLRERAKMRLKVHALSAEGRFSAGALSLIPAAVYAVVTATTPTYYSDVRGDPWFTTAIYMGLGLWLAGVFVMHRMVKFKF